MPELLTASEAADRLKVTPSTVARWANDGRLAVHYKAPGKRGQMLFTAEAVTAAALERAAEMDAKRPAVSA